MQLKLHQYNGSEVNFGLTKAKNMMFYTPEKFPPHDKDAWKQYSNLTCDELRPLLKKNESMKIRSLKYNLMPKMKILLNTGLQVGKFLM